MPIIAQDTTFFVNTGHSKSVLFKGGTSVTFRPDGSVSQGTLRNDTTHWVNTSHSKTGLPDVLYQ